MIYEPESFTPLLQLQQPTDTPIREQDKVLAEVMGSLQSTLDYLPAPEAYELSRSVREQTIAKLKASEQSQTPEPPNECYFYHCNHLGLPEALTNQNGEAVWAASYDAWGNVKEDHNPNNLHQPIRLPGQYHDPETNLYYNRHRYYVPKLGNYINQDPIGLARGEPNLTVYPRNPVQWMDPLGLVYGLGNGPYGQSSMVNRNSAESVVDDVVLKTVLTGLNPPDAGDITRDVLQNSRGPSPTVKGEHAAFGACYNNARIKTCMDRLDEYEAAAKADKSAGKNPLIQIGGEVIREFGAERTLCESENVCDLRGYVKEPAIWPPELQKLPGEFSELPSFSK